MQYVQNVFSGELLDNGFATFEDKTGNGKRIVTGILIVPRGNSQTVSVTLRYRKGAKFAFRKIQVCKRDIIDNIPYDLFKGYHELNIPVENDILTGSIESKGQGKVNVYLRYD